MNAAALMPLLWGTLIFLLLNAFVCLWRGLVGPTLPDRILAVNVIGTKTMVALVYGLLSFTVTLVAGRLLESDRLKGIWRE